MKSEIIILSPDEVRQIIRDEINDALCHIIGTSQTTDRLLTAPGVCKMLSINNSTLWRWCKAGIINPVRIGGMVRYKQSDIEKLTTNDPL